MSTVTEAEAIYLSPHLDDAVLSCGGQIAERVWKGRRTAVITLFARDEPGEGISDFAARLHRYWGLGDAVVAARREEDKAACARLGARAEHWDELEGIYRTGGGGESLYPDREHLFGAVDSTDREIEERLARRLAELPPECELLCPLAAGGHVDHLLVRRAAETARGRRLAYYEDYPYVHDDRRAVATAQAGGEWTAEVIPVSAAGLEAKIEAVALYASQLRVLFRGRRRMARRIGRFTRRLGGERIWRRFPERPLPAS